MQDGGWGKIVQLQAIILQRPSEEWVKWKSHAPQQIGDEAHLLSHRWIGKILHLGFVVEGSQPRSNTYQIRRGEKPLCLQLHQLTVGYGALLPLASFWAAGTGGGAGNARHVGVFFPGNL